MRPILLKGGERPLTQVKYNAEGDLLFSASKVDLDSTKLFETRACLKLTRACSQDDVVNVWFSHNGER